MVILDEVQDTIEEEMDIRVYSPRMKVEIIIELSERASQTAVGAVLGALPPEKHRELFRSAEQGDLALQIFLDTELPRHRELVHQTVREEVERFKKLSKTTY